MATNEITIETRVDHLLKNVFPTFRKVDVIHQTAFTLKFGHHVISIDGKAPKRNYARAISDILLKVEDVNLILLELKKEGLKIDGEDIEQGLSYARLIHPMPPITLISNGKDHFFYDTYSKQKIDNPPTDLVSIKNLIDNTFKLALTDRKNVVEVLLNNDVEIIMQIFNDISAEKFERLKGPVEDFTKPISDEFLIERNIVDVIDETLRTKNVIGIIGNAFSGKTNILYQFYKRHCNKENGLLYVDCKDFNFSLFQQLSNHFSKVFEFPVNKDKVREWIISSSNKSKSFRLVLILDNLNKGIDNELSHEITELVELFKGTENVILYSADTFSFVNISTIENRSHKTILGDISTIIEIKNLSDSEYEAANEELWKVGKAIIQHGGNKAIEYREPRRLRYLSVAYKSEINELKADQFCTILSIPGFDLMKAITNSLIYTSAIRDVFRKYANAFIQDEVNRKKNPYLNIAASGNGAVTLATAKEILGSDFETLLSSGIVTIREFEETGQVLFPKTQELLSYYSIELIQKKVEECTDIENAYRAFIDLCTPLPYNDIVGSEVLNKIVLDGNVDLFINLVGKLLSSPPQKQLIGKGTKILNYFEDIGHLKIDFKENTDESSFIPDFLPYIILSQLVSYPFQLGIDNEEPNFLYYLKLVQQIASTPSPMVRMYTLPFKEMQPLTTWNLKKFGEIVCGTEGIIEPIVQSIFKAFHLAPELIEILYEDAIKEHNFPLLWRIYLALRNEENTVDIDAAQKVKKFINEFNKAFPEIFSEIMTQDIQNESEKKRIQTILKKHKSSIGDSPEEK